MTGVNFLLWLVSLGVVLLGIAVVIKLGQSELRKMLDRTLNDILDNNK